VGGSKFKAGSRQTHETLSKKVTKAKRAGVVAQVVESLPPMRKQKTKYK
jgi:hypothetical protein